MRAPAHRCDAAQFSRTSDAIRLAIAQQRRVEAVRTMVSARRNWRAFSRLLLVVATTAAVSTAFVFIYTALLSLQGIPASTPALLAVLLAATLASIAGFAFSAICGVMLLQIISDPVQVVQVMIVCSIAIQSASVAVLWRDIDWRRVMIFLAGGVVGLPIGVWLLLHLGHLWFKEAIGGLLIAYAALRLLRRPWVLESDSDLADTCIGFLGGISGGLAGFPGAAVTIWCGMKGWDKRCQRGIYQPFILIMQVIALMLIQFMRPSSVARDAGLGLDPMQFIPVALLGTWFGLVIFRRLSDRSFALTVNLLLLVSGVGLLV
jgi:hypothetical protein